MTITWTQRNDLCTGNMTACYLAPDKGVLVRRPGGWWASNDSRPSLVGIKPNEELVQPTLGPFSTRSVAERAYVTAPREKGVVNVFANFDFHPRTIEHAEVALPSLESNREYVALALLALDQAGVDVETQKNILETLARRGHA